MAKEETVSVMIGESNLLYVTGYYEPAVKAIYWPTEKAAPGQRESFEITKVEMECVNKGNVVTVNITDLLIELDSELIYKIEQEVLKTLSR